MAVTNGMVVVKCFKINSRGRDFIVGDIHGRFDVLRVALDKLLFDASIDRMFSVGDLIDRGMFSEEVVYWLGRPWFHAVRGNHEQMVIDGFAGVGDIPRHIRNGGGWFYELPKPKQLTIYSALRKLPLMIQVDQPGGQKIGVVHAEVPQLLGGGDWQEAIDLFRLSFNDSVSSCLYSRDKFNRQDNSMIRGVDKVFVGHTTVPDIIGLGNVLYVDTGCSFDDGVLSVINIQDGAVTQQSMIRYK